jgi:mRNA interferase MazF
MTSFQPGDLVLVAFPFTGSGQTKNRPALVILDTGDADVVLARVTTQAPSTSMDIPLTQWQASGLLASSTVRLHKMATIEKTRVRRILGNLQPPDRQQVSTVLRQTYGSW